MTNDSIQRYTVSGDIAYPINEDPEGDYVTYEDHVAAIEADRQRRQLDAEEVCAEVYQVVGSLLSDLGIFETHRAEKILDNLSQAKMVHDDVLPWPSFDRKRQGEVVITKTPEGEIIAVTRQDDEGRILSVIAEADRQRWVESQEPFGYFRALPFGWTDCAATDEGAIALYERPQAQGGPVGIVKRPSEAHYPGVQWLTDVKDGDQLYTAQSGGGDGS